MDAKTAVKHTAEGKHEQTNQSGGKLKNYNGQNTIFCSGVKIDPLNICLI